MCKKKKKKKTVNISGLQDYVYATFGGSFVGQVQHLIVLSWADNFNKYSIFKIARAHELCEILHALICMMRGGRGGGASTRACTPATVRDGHVFIADILHNHH